MAFNNADYVDVAERIRQFKKEYPQGCLQSFVPPYMVEAGGKMFVVYGAAAYRTPDDARPGVGWAWEPVPGPTQFTKDSELQNAETSAWGRAIVALGFETKHIASANEVRNRQPDASAEAPPAAVDSTPLVKKLLELARELGAEASTVTAIDASISKRNPAEHAAWLERCIATAEQNLANEPKFKAPKPKAAK